MPQQQIKDKYVHWAETLPNIFKMSIICGVKQTILFVSKAREILLHFIYSVICIYYMQDFCILNIQNHIKGL